MRKKISVEKKESTALAKQFKKEDFVGFDGVERQGIFGLICNIRQRASVIEVDGKDIPLKAGRFQFSDSRADIKELKMIVLFSKKTRTLWTEKRGAPGPGQPICRSYDAIKGNVYGLCRECKFSEWEEGLPPLCGEEMNYIGLIENEEKENGFELCAFRAKGTGLKPSKNYLYMLIEERKTPPWSIWTIIKSKEETSGGNVYYIPIMPDISDGELDYINDDLLEYVREQRRVISPLFMKEQVDNEPKDDKTEDDEAEGDDVKEPDETVIDSLFE